MHKMLLYRIGSTKYINDLTGDGAKNNGGRWNHVGTPCIYSAATKSLSLLEYTAHAKIHLIPRALSFITLEVPDHSIRRYTAAQLPGNWKDFPHPKETRDFGTKFLADNKFLLYQLPSVVIEDEMNFIINPSHPDMKMVKVVSITDYVYDLRLKTN
jgi:RES domain-containing protein